METKPFVSYSKDHESGFKDYDSSMGLKSEGEEVKFLPSKATSVQDESADVDGEALKIVADDDSSATQLTSKRKYRLALLAFWIFGVCNSFAYVVMLSAAHDILHDDNDYYDNETLRLNCSNCSLSDQVEFEESDVLYCNQVSTGAILLADVIPTLFVTLTFPFFLQQIPYNIKLALVVGFGAASFVVVAFAHEVWLSVIGVVFASISAGLGEITFLSMSTFYHKDVVSSWSSGTGGAGVFGALVYAGFTSLGLSPRTSLLIMLFIPALLLIAYAFILPSAGWNEPSEDNKYEVKDSVAKLTYKQKVALLPYLMKYMIPLAIVYFAEYFINQGLHEFLYFNDEFLSRSAQYRWYQVDYQIGVFISRSSVNFVHIRKLWILPTLQVVNLVLLLFQLYYRFIPSFWIIIVIILWEGLLGGGAYVNTFYRMTNDLSSDVKEYCIGVATFGDSVGIAAAGAAAIPFHNYICGLKLKV